MMADRPTRIGAYDILGRLGAGGMGEVYRARDSKLGRDVAIKILPASLAADAERLARFEREARLLASLNHPHIAQIYGLEGSAIVMELVDGGTLAERIARGPLKAGDALAIARQIADALDAAHERGIIHRDLKPSNVALTADGAVKLLDFGLAKDGADAPAAGLTHSPTMMSPTVGGVLLGTAPYMSPEQARGRAVDKRTDIWAFGCVLYEMLTGRQAFSGDTISDTIAAILEREPDWSPLPPSTSPAVRRVVQRCLEKDPRRRQRDIADARVQLDEAAAPASSPSREPRRSNWLVAATVVALAVAAAAVLWAFRSSRADSGLHVTRAIRLTNTPLEEFGPMISPDNKWIAFYQNTGQRTDVWVRYLDSGATLNLTKDLNLELQVRAGIGGLDISPDGALIAFTARPADNSTAAFDTWVIPAPLGGAPRKLLSSLNAMRWSHDGKRLVAMRAGASLGDSLWIANADGTDLKMLLPVSGGRHIHFPAWSADGRWIYFIGTYITWHDEPSEVFRVSVDGGVPELVVRTHRRALFPVPLPGGGLVFSANPYSVEIGLWWQPAAGGAARPLTSGVGEHSEGRLSLDGRHLLVTYSTMRQSLVRIVADGPAAGEVQRITDGYSGDLYPSVAAATGRMVFSSSRSGGRNLWIARADGSNPMPLTTENVIDEHPEFSPDGRQIAFVSDRGGRRGIWVISADGGAPRLVGAADVLDTLAWTPDATRILFATTGDRLPILKAITVADGTIRTVPTPAAAHSPAWSPVTNELAYLEPTPPTESAPSRTYVAFLDANGQAIHTNVPKSGMPFQNGFLAWSPDGRRVAVIAAQANANAELWIADPRASPPLRRLRRLDVSVRPRGISWTPDGAAVILAEQRSDADIVMLDLDDGRARP